MTDHSHFPVPPAPDAPRGSVLWTCTGTDCEWTATSLLPEATRMSSYAQHLVAALALTGSAAPTAAAASASIVDAALLARVESLQDERDTATAELEHLREMLAPVAAYLTSDRFADTAAKVGASGTPTSGQNKTTADPTTDPTADRPAAPSDGAPSVSDMLDAVDGVVRIASDVVDTAWPVISKLLRGAAR